jgi:hypothetical protein
MGHWQEAKQGVVKYSFVFATTSSHGSILSSNHDPRNPSHVSLANHADAKNDIHE